MSEQGGAKMSLDGLLSIRNSTISIYVNEANGIWQRFNFIVIVQIAFFTGALSILREETSFTRLVIVTAICFIGIQFALNAIVALSRLWHWHHAFYEQLLTIERRIEELCISNSISNIYPMPLMEISRGQIVNKLGKGYSIDNNRFNSMFKIISKYTTLVIVEKKDSDEFREYVEKRPTHRFLYLFIVAWVMLFAIELFGWISRTGWNYVILWFG